MSIIKGITSGISLLSGVLDLRERMSGSRGLANLGALMTPSTYATPGMLTLPGGTIPTAMPGGSMVTGGRFGSTSSGAYYGPGALVPSGYHLAKDGSGRIVRNRRMNPLNPSAARRAIRRIKGARRMLKSIESSLPKRAAPRVARKR